MELSEGGPQGKNRPTEEDGVEQSWGGRHWGWAGEGL